MTIEGMVAVDVADIKAKTDLIPADMASLGLIVVGSGTFTTSSATVPADTGQGAKDAQYWKGCLLMPTSGAAAKQPRMVRSFATSTGVFTLDGDMPFTAAPGLVDYILLADANWDHLAGADATRNQDMNDVVGNKADAAVDTVGNTASLMAYLKWLVNQSSTGIGTVFGIVKTLTHSQIVGGGVDLTGVSSGGLLELIGYHVQNGSTAMSSAENGAQLALHTNNVKGNNNFLVIDGTDLSEYVLFDQSIGDAYTTVLETGKKIIAKAQNEDFTSAGLVDFYLIFRRLAAGATVAAAS